VAPGLRPASAGPVDPQRIADLIDANHILAHQQVLDGWGHVSVRHDRDPSRFLLCAARAPALVGPGDVIEYDLDCVAVDPAGRNEYTERFIHGAIYRARPDVEAVVHSHAPALIPFGVSTVPLQPLYHRAAFVAQGVPVFEIRETAGMTDLLIRDAALGHALARRLGAAPAVLMRGHGVTVVGPSLPRLVSRAIFLVLNATLQQQALALGGPITYLDPEEARLIEAREGYGLTRAWEAWRQQVRALRAGGGS
jgi:ribulose-5-phosphate 4-epimerase/fuculose-1-phosphate aldolase